MTYKEVAVRLLQERPFGVLATLLFTVSLTFEGNFHLLSLLLGILWGGIIAPFDAELQNRRRAKLASR